MIASAGSGDQRVAMYITSAGFICFSSTYAAAFIFWAVNSSNLHMRIDGNFECFVRLFRR